ncbi:hypothetical protein [Enterobacter phage 01_vB_Eclo_IJM]|nr:hypothetical protein [Enterobacter phage 01_vB_Eclo_IJM]
MPVVFRDDIVTKASREFNAKFFGSPKLSSTSENKRPNCTSRSWSTRWTQGATT